MMKAVAARPPEGILYLDTQLSNMLDELEEIITRLQDKLSPISNPEGSLGPDSAGVNPSRDRDVTPSEFRARMENNYDQLGNQMNRLRVTTSLVDI